MMDIEKIKINDWYIDRASNFYVESLLINAFKNKKEQNLVNKGLKKIKIKKYKK